MDIFLPVQISSLSSISITSTICCDWVTPGSKDNPIQVDSESEESEHLGTQDDPIPIDSYSDLEEESDSPVYGEPGFQFDNELERFQYDIPVYGEPGFEYDNVLERRGEMMDEEVDDMEESVENPPDQSEQNQEPDVVEKRVTWGFVYVREIPPRPNQNDSPPPVGNQNSITNLIWTIKL